MIHKNKIPIIMLTLAIISYFVTILFGLILWQDTKTLHELALYDNSDMLTFYKISQLDPSIWQLIVSNPKSVLLNYLIQFSEAFTEQEFIIFISIKWAVYMMCSYYFFNTLSQYIHQESIRIFILAFLLINFPVLVHIPQILRDDLITSFFILFLSAYHRMIHKNHYPEQKYFFKNPKYIFLLSIILLFLTRPEYLIVALFITFILHLKNKRRLTVFLVLIIFFSQNPYLLWSELQYWIVLLNFEPITFIDSFRAMLFSPAPNNAIEVYYAGRSHSLAAFWFLLGKPIGFLMVLIIIAGFFLKPSMFSRLVNKSYFKTFILVPLLCISIVSFISLPVQGPRQAMPFTIPLSVFIFVFFIHHFRFRGRI